MLHHYDGVRCVTELLERGDQAVVVALVEAYAGLVEDIEHVDKLRAYLCGEPYALAFAPRQGGRAAVERQIAQAHVNEESEPRAYLLEYFAGYERLRGRQPLLYGLRPFVERGDVHAAQLGYVLAVDKEVECLAVEPCAVALRTFDA